MKKLITLLTLLCMALTSQAIDVTIADYENSSDYYGSFTSNIKSFTTNDASGMAGVTIEATTSGVTIGPYDLSSNPYPYGKGFKIVTSNTSSQTITLTAPEGYIITDYSIGASANSSGKKHTLTAADGTTKVEDISSLGMSNNEFKYLNVSGLSDNSTTFTIQTANNGDILYIAYFTLTLEKESAFVSKISSGKYYRLHSAAYENKAVRELGGLLITEVPDKNVYSQLWKIATRGSGYSIQNAVSGKYIQSVSNHSVQFSTGSSPVTFYSGTEAGETKTKFWFSAENSTTSYKALHCAKSNYYKVVSWPVIYSGTAEEASYWYLEEVEVNEETLAALQAQTLSNGYYRLTNASYTDRSMADGGGTVSAPTTVATSYAQIWKLTVSGSTCTLKNALTDKYIQSQPGTSAQYKTGSNSYSFNVISKESGGSILHSFQDPNSTWYGLHCASTQSYNVVGWNYAEDPSYWTVTKVDVDETDLQNLKNTLNVDYTSQLATYFTDAACTTLKSTYKNYTDDNLRSAMSSLPTVLQEMAVSVKNDTWNSSKGTKWNSYEKDFRIHSYDIFSNSDLWKAKTKTGPFAHLFHPTGIQATAGEFVYLFVDSDLKDSDASLEVECVAGTDRKGAAYTLKKGYNAIYVPCDCEIFVSYLLNNTDKSCNDYPNITVHIEGGTCNGCFDMRGHNHTNSDWEWLKKNMFTNTYLHVKGNSTILNCLRERVVDTSTTQNVEGIMAIWDFVFDTEESLSGTDKWKSTGHYKMMVNNYDNEAGGNPFWSNGGYGYSQPGIYKDAIFNYNVLSNVGTGGGQIWVIEHELGHGHQSAINMAGTTEASNNSLAQIVNFLTVDSKLFQTSRSSRAQGVKEMIEKFNSSNGTYSWIDYAGQRGTDDLWISNRWIFQLWLYFDYLKNYEPQTNNGFAFISALYDAMRDDPIVKSGNSSAPALATDDYLKLAKHCATISQTDLSDFFDAWGFWELTPVKADDKDIAGSYTWHYGDYGDHYIQTSQTQVDEVRNYMKTLPNKGGHLMFIEDRCVGSKLATWNDATVESFGETGYYETYNQSISGTYKPTFNGTTITLENGSGAVGFKVYDDEGNLVALSNTTSFTLPADVATALKEGTYRLVAAQGNGEDVAINTQEDFSTEAYENIFPYFTTNVGKYFALSQACYDEWYSKAYLRSTLSCTQAEYEELQNAVANGIRYPKTGLYRIKSSGTRQIGESYIGYGSPKTNNLPDGLITIAAANAKSDATTVFTLTEAGTTGQYTLSTNGLNVQNQTSYNTPFHATTATGAVFTFEIQSLGVVAISSDMDEKGYFHEANDTQGWTIPGVVRWKATETPSHWTIEDAFELGDVNHDGNISISDVTALVNIVQGKTTEIYYNLADMNQDGVITIADVTALINKILGK